MLVAPIYPGIKEHEIIPDALSRINSPISPHLRSIRWRRCLFAGMVRSFVATRPSSGLVTWVHEAYPILRRRAPRLARVTRVRADISFVPSRSGRWHSSSTGRIKGSASLVLGCSEAIPSSDPRWKAGYKLRYLYCVYGAFEGLGLRGRL